MTTRAHYVNTAADTFTGIRRFQFVILMALQLKPQYMGTVSPAVVAKRRAANRQARASRKANRR